jgi:hypothetical protein
MQALADAESAAADLIKSYLALAMRSLLLAVGGFCGLEPACDSRKCRVLLTARSRDFRGRERRTITITITSTKVSLRRGGAAKAWMIRLTLTALFRRGEA